MTIKLEMLRVFRAVAERGSLAEAAAALGRSPSAVSMMLSQFETEVGAPLFETDRKNRLTRLGEAVLAEATRATDVFEGSAEAIRRLTASTAGTVRVAAVPTVIATRLPGAVARFRRAHPGVRLEISDLDSAAVRRMVRSDEADIGILTGDGEAPEDGVAIARDALGIVYHHAGAIAQALSGGAAPTWGVLELEPLIGNPLCALVPEAGLQDRLARCALAARNTTALLSFVREGLGATVLPESVTVLLGRELTFARPTDPEAWRELRLIRNAGRRPSPAAAAFWDTLL